MTEPVDMVPNWKQPIGIEESSLRSRLKALQAQIKQFKAAISEVQPQTVESDVPPVDPQLVRDHIATLARREEILGSNLFGDPAWELLLQGFAAALSYERLTTSIFITRVKLPPSTTSRWLKKLEADGLLQRETDPFDARLSLISLTPQAFEGLVRYFTLRWSVAEVSESESINSLS
jgi:DNA-binding transcriptional ArsR family regulator